MITLQDPSDLTTRDVDSFHYLKHKLKVDEAPEANPAAAHIRLNSATSSVLDELYKTMDADKKKQQEKDAAKLKALLEQAPDEEDEYANFVPEVFSTRSTGSTAASLTSTAMTIATAQRGERVDRDTLRYAEVKTKSYVSITTNLGKLNLELHSDLVPKTVENFIRLAKKGYYNNTTFHRNIKHFMIQGGDPTATGTGGASAWGKPFADEFKPNLLHDARGIVSMANSGPGTNGSQFFITYRPCKHLDRKHTVFGKVVGGIETLAAMERIEVDKDDKPVTPITIVSVEVFVEPYRDADEKLKALFLRQQAEKLGGSVVSSSAAAASSPKAKDTPVVAASSSLSTPASGASVPAARSESKPVGSGGVGRYLAQNAAATTTGSKRPASEALEGDSKRPAVTLPPAAKPRAQYGNFSNW
ncbi:peptidyl-prolyl cis-trans isomerase-like 2, variant [Capsaspora owczarzaki ATCC 30864]|nr:peptidyl-prolyl cis-trans isomerase-like 2, variant [Capsaspora owczarzaki ATCC 30864]